MLPFDGGPQEQVLLHQELQVVAAATGTGYTVLAPVTERGEAIGLLEISVPTKPTAQMLDEIGRTAHALAFVVIANRRHTDLFEWGSRRAADGRRRENNATTSARSGSLPHGGGSTGMRNAQATLHTGTPEPIRGGNTTEPPAGFRASPSAP
jgi:hypothetical protein